jgi:hypothetical protein
VAPETVRDSLGWPTEAVTCLDGHEAVGHLAENVRRCETQQILMFNPIQEELAGRSVGRVSDDRVDQRVGVEKDADSGWDICKRHS